MCELGGKSVDICLQKIITDESVKKPVEEEVTSDLLEACTADLSRIVSAGAAIQGKATTVAESCDLYSCVM